MRFARTDMILTLLVAVTISVLSQAQTYSVVYTFHNYDGSQPQAGVISDPAGNLYGTTRRGGQSDYGTVFKLSKGGGETVLHSFSGGVDGWYPEAPLLLDPSGNLYGTTTVGSNGGTVFEVDNTGQEMLVYGFAGAPDGDNPAAGLIRDAGGNLYGTTLIGGVNSAGTVFKIDSSLTESVLYSFADGAGGRDPSSELLRDSSGNLYGTTEAGGNLDCYAPFGCGTVFKLDPAGNYTVVHTFGFGTDGQIPAAGLIADKMGNLYGTTLYGGAYGYGSVFKLNVASGVERLLYSFHGQVDGKSPAAGLVRDLAGNLYGTTEEGGASGGYGTVFELSATGETVLHSFSGGSDGRYPISRLLLDSRGNLYGTTRLGGAGYGVVFKISFP